MKNKKILLVGFAILLIVLLGLAYLFRPMTMNDIYDEPNFSGTVLETSDHAMLVAVNEGEDELKTCDRISVSLDVQLKDSMTQFDVGTQVKVFYDGSIAETDPAQVNTVFAILPKTEPS